MCRKSVYVVKEKSHYMDISWTLMMNDTHNYFTTWCVHLYADFILNHVFKLLNKIKLL